MKTIVIGWLCLNLLLWTSGLLAQHYWHMPVWPAAFVAVMWMIGGGIFGACVVAGFRETRHGR
jgi:hypothetical protein